MNLKMNGKWIAAVACIFLVACGDDSENTSRTGELTKEQARTMSGKSDRGADLCQVHNWYGDGVCDDFCPRHDEDCATTCASNADCAEGEFCGFEAGLCGGDGTCATRPDACIALYDPVCGCDGQTYGNACNAASAGVAVATDGECATTTCTSNADCAAGQACINGLCEIGSDEGCASNSDCAQGESCVNGECTASNTGCAENADCGDDEFCAFAEACGGTGACSTMPEACIALYDPVCGCDGTTYSNSCYAASAGASVAYDGECQVANTCNANVDCAQGETCVDGMCVGSAPGCTSNADCAQGQYCHLEVSVACGTSGDGECRVQPDACIALYDPVCGCDDQTYSNGCVANSAGVSVKASGSCN
jgi:Cys-rich repeat protein